MYAALWRRLPGPTWVRALLMLVLVVLVLAVCVQWLFPWVADVVPFNEQTVEAPSSVRSVG